MTTINHVLNETLSTIRANGLLRAAETVVPVSGRHILVDGVPLLNFSSNNYLGLAMDPRVKEAAAEAVRTYGCGSGASRLVGGSFPLHAALEQKLAALKQCEAALVFASGYQANVGTISALAGPGDCVIMDRLNHASLWDGAKLSGARIFVYDHCDCASLEKVLHRAKEYARRLVVTDSVFSMDGDCAPLPDIVRLCRQYGAWSMIDEAHATGVLGPSGAGLSETTGVERSVDIVMGTLSKALGSQGGFVCGSRALIDVLLNRSRSFIYSTALAPAACAAALAALDIVSAEPARRTRLASHACRLREGLGLPCAAPVTPIIAHIVGTAAAATDLSARLRAAGIYAPAIRPPTVPEGTCRLRFSLTSDHTMDDIETVLRAVVP